MKKIGLTNTREHDITLSAKGLESVTIPGGKQNAAGTIEPGFESVPEDLIVAASEQSDAVKHYFTEGWLVPGEAAEQADADAEKPAKKTAKK